MKINLPVTEVEKLQEPNKDRNLISIRKLTDDSYSLVTTINLSTTINYGNHGLHVMYIRNTLQQLIQELPPPRIWKRALVRGFDLDKYWK